MCIKGAISAWTRDTVKSGDSRLAFTWRFEAPESVVAAASATGVSDASGSSWRNRPTSRKLPCACWPADEGRLPRAGDGRHSFYAPR